MIDLTAEQKDNIAKRLAYSATAGGWFMIGMALFVLAVFIWYAWQRSAGQISAEGEEGMIAFLMLGLAFAGFGGWLLRRRAKVRRDLDLPLTAGTATITADSGPTENGWTLTLDVKKPADLAGKAHLGGYSSHPWQIGDTIDVAFLPDNEKFFPTAIDYNGAMGYLVTAERVSRNRRFTTLMTIILVVLLAIGFLIGLWNQINPS